MKRDRTPPAIASAAVSTKHVDDHAMRRRPTQLALLIAAATALPLWGGAAMAQEARAQLEEVIVTARKREESLQATPISISAFSAEQLREIGLTELTSLSASVPNLQMQQDAAGGSAMTACMRGLCRTDAILTEDQMVGIYIDGFANSTAFGTFFELLDIERVEVLRGPQGTLFGKNTVGGAINIVTTPPSGEWGGRVELGVGSDSLLRGRAVMDMPVADTLAAKLAISKTQRDGLINNRIGDDLNARDNQAARLALRWTPSDAATIDYFLDWFEADQARNPFQFTYADQGLNRLFPGISADASPRRLNTRSVIDGSDEVNQISHGLTVSWDLGSVGMFEDFSIKSLSGYKDVSNDTTGSTSQWWFLGADTQQSVKTVSQELQIAGTAFDGRMNMVSGVYYSRVEGSFENFFHFGSPAILNIQDLSTENESWALFGELSYDISERLSTSVGLRYTDETREADLNILAPDGSLRLPVSTLAEEDSFETDDLSPRFSLQYQINDDTMAYTTLSRGFKSGGLNGRASKPLDFVVYDDMVLDSAELGIKSDLLDRRLRINAAVFYQEAEDLQIQVNSLDTDTRVFLTRIENAGEATMKGFELDLRFQATPSLEIFGAFGFIDTEYDEFLAFNPATGGRVDVSDQREFQFAPERTGNIGLRYERQVAVGNFVARMDYAYVGEQHFTVVEEKRITGDSYQLLNARVELQDISGSPFSLALWGKNLQDEEYRIGGFSVATFAIAPPDGLGTNIYGDPRTWGVDLSYRFE
jgi:iron complex outermembrane recepter protein